VRDEATGAPLAWAVEYDDGSWGMLHVQEMHRRRGLGRLCLLELMMQLVAKRREQWREWKELVARELGDGAASDMQQGSFVPFCYVVQTNTASQTLLERLGIFTRSSEMYSWMHFKAGSSTSVQER